jgi:hypothetical protein
MNHADLVYAICHWLGMRPNHAAADPSQSRPEKEPA